MSLYVVYEYVPCPRRAVVVEIIVAVNPVLRQVVGIDGVAYGGLLAWRKVEFLLVDGASFRCVFHAEIVERHDAHLVIRLAEDEP